MREALVTTLNYCAGENYAGYSLYDSHNGFVPFSALGKHASFIANQVVKRSPVNLRPLLGIKKGLNPKGIGLFLHALSNLAEGDFELPGVQWVHSSMQEEMQFFFRWLKSNPSPGYHGYSWGYNFDWPKRDGSIVPAYTPSSVVTGFNARGVYAYYVNTPSVEAAKVLRGAAEFIVEHIPVTETKDGLCYSYTPLKRDLTLNASLLAAEVLTYSDVVSGDREFEEQITGVLEFTKARQNSDGSWYYSYSTKTGSPRRQIDFHQGYVLESVFRICTTYGIELNHYADMLHNGMRFYSERQIDSTGRAIWRYPRRWPVDIHNQSQAILTPLVLRPIWPHGLETASRVLSYTLEHMRDLPSGRFYYQKWPGFVTRTSYMRWNQAWMVLAMSQMLLSMSGPD